MPLALVHEGTLVHAVSVLALWCNRFTTEVPKKLTDWFKKVFSLKTSTSAVRHAYLQCMLASFRGKMLASTGGPLSPWVGGRAGGHAHHSGPSLWHHRLGLSAFRVILPVCTEVTSSLA